MGHPVIMSHFEILPIWWQKGHTTEIFSIDCTKSTFSLWQSTCANFLDHFWEFDQTLQIYQAGRTLLSNRIWNHCHLNPMPMNRRKYTISMGIFLLYFYKIKILKITSYLSKFFTLRKGWNSILKWRVYKSDIVSYFYKNQLGTSK